MLRYCFSPETAKHQAQNPLKNVRGTLEIVGTAYTFAIKLHSSLL